MNPAMPDKTLLLATAIPCFLRALCSQWLEDNYLFDKKKLLRAQPTYHIYA